MKPRHAKGEPHGTEHPHRCGSAQHGRWPARRCRLICAYDGLRIDVLGANSDTAGLEVCLLRAAVTPKPAA